MVRESRSAHKKTLDYLLFHPEIFGIEKREIFTSSSEQVLFHRGKPYGRVDLVYFLRPIERGTIVVEYKSTSSYPLRKKGKIRVERAVHHFRDGGIPSIGYLIEGELPFLNGTTNGTKPGEHNGYEKKYCITRINPVQRFKK